MPSPSALAQALATSALEALSACAVRGSVSELKRGPGPGSEGTAEAGVGQGLDGGRVTGGLGPSPSSPAASPVARSQEYVFQEGERGLLHRHAAAAEGGPKTLTFPFPHETAGPCPPLARRRPARHSGLLVGTFRASLLAVKGPGLTRP